MCTTKGTEQRCRKVHSCTNGAGETAKPRIEPVPDSLVTSMVGAVSNLHGANVQRTAATPPAPRRRALQGGGTDVAATLRSIARKSQQAMTAGVLPGEYIKTVTSPLLDLAIQVDSPGKLTEAPVSLAPNVRVKSPSDAFSDGDLADADAEAASVVEMSATAWGAGASPFPGATNPPRKKPDLGPNQMFDGSNDTATMSTVLSTGVLSLEFSAEGGEELEIRDLDEPFVVEMVLDGAALVAFWSTLRQCVLCFSIRSGLWTQFR